MLDATGRNNMPVTGRLFDATLVYDSPKKILNKWTDQFGQALRPKSELDYSKLEPSPSPIKPKNQNVPARSATPKPEDASAASARENDLKDYLESKQLMRGKRRQHKVKKEEVLAGRSNWQQQSPGFKSGQGQRTERIQAKLKEEIYKLQLQGLTEVQKEAMEEQLMIEAA